MLYDLNTIQTAIERFLGKTVSKSKLREELEKPVWEPELNRMIAVANNYANLASTGHYGIFNGTVDGLYRVEGGALWNHARPLTPEEIAKCF